MAGSERRKEKRKASSLLAPVIKVATIVLPDLDIPGITANPWARPAIRPVQILMLLSLKAMRPAQFKSEAVTMRPQATAQGTPKALEATLSMGKATIAVTNVPSITAQPYFQPELSLKLYRSSQGTIPSITPGYHAKIYKD